MRRTRARYSVIAFVVAIGIITFVLFVATRTPPWVPQGRVVLAQYAVPSSPDTVGTIGLGVDDVELTRAEGDPVSATVLARRITVDASDGRIRVLTDTSLPSGSYTGVRFRLTSPETRSAIEGGEASRPLVLGGETLMLDLPFEVRENETNVILLGFETRGTIHEDNGASVYLPVIHAEIRSGSTVLPAEDNVVRVAEGSILGSALFGMDWNGAMRFNFRPPALRPSESVLTEDVPMEEPVADDSVVDVPLPNGTTTLHESDTDGATSTSPGGDVSDGAQEDADPVEG